MDGVQLAGIGVSLIPDAAESSGTVTLVSVVGANGFAGSVANETTTPAITLATSVTGILQGNGTAISAATTTGSGSVVLATSPTLMTPTLGVASATSINKVSVTAPASGSTLTIADGKTATFSNTLTLAGTDSSTLNIGTGGTLGTGAFAAAGITQLTGDVTAGTGSGSQAATLATTQPNVHTWSALQTFSSGLTSGGAVTISPLNAAGILINSSLGVVSSTTSPALANVKHSAAEVDTSYGYFTPSSAGTVTMTAGMGRAIINPAGTLTSLTIILPPNPVEGQVVRGATSQAITIVTMNTSDGSSIIAGLSSLAVDGTFAFLFRSATTSWYPSN